MLDRRLQPVIKATFAAPARWLASIGVSADALTIVGFLVGLCGAGCLALRAYLPALVLLLLNRIFDGLDGALARLVGPTDRGAFLDVAFDFLFTLRYRLASQYRTLRIMVFRLVLFFLALWERRRVFWHLPRLPNAVASRRLRFLTREFSI
jgi:phosphatidylglycerophosphate synthase